MGAKRKVDEKLYNKIKKELNTPKDDKKVMRKYRLGQTLVRAIRNSWCYDDFLSRITHKKITLISSRRRVPQRTLVDTLIIIGVYVVLFSIFTIICMVIMWGLQKFFGVEYR